MDFADTLALSEPDRERAVAEVGRPLELALRSALDVSAQAQEWRDATVQALKRAPSINAAASAVPAILGDVDPGPLARRLAQSMAQADLAGQLFVRDVELGTEVALRDTARFEAFLNRPFPEAIDFAVRRGLVGEEGLSDLLRRYRQTGDLAAGRVFAEIQRRAESAIQSAVRDGTSLEAFVETVEADTQSLGMGTRDRSYLDTVFRTSIQSAYGAGRFTQMTHPDVVAARPYVEYVTAGDSRVRPEHEVLHGLIFPSDSPEWARIAPPNGFNCRCSMITRKAEDVDTSRVVVHVPTEIAGVRPGADDPRFDRAPTEQVAG